MAPVVGTRYMCLDCAGCDLCGECYGREDKRGHHLAHSFRVFRYCWQSDPAFCGDLVPQAPLSRGDASKRVLHLQYVLIERGVMNGTDISLRAGFFGEKTVEAVKNFQRLNGLEEAVTALGVYDSITRASLLRACNSSDVAMASGRSANLFGV